MDRPENTRCLLGLADEQHALGEPPVRQILLGQLILALILFEGDQIQVMGLGKALNGPDEGRRQWRDHGGGSDRIPQVMAYEMDETTFGLQP